MPISNCINDNVRPDGTENTHDISDFKCKGYAVVINNAASASYSTKLHKLQDTFSKIKFEIKEVINNSTIEIIRQKLHEESDRIKKKRIQTGCIFVIVLTQYDEDGRLIANNRSYNSSEIFIPFQKYEEMQDIPKIFIFLVEKKAKQNTEQCKKRNESVVLQILPGFKDPNCLIFISPLKENLIKNLRKQLDSWRGSGVDIANLLRCAHNKANIEKSANMHGPILMSSLQKTIIFGSSRCTRAEQPMTYYLLSSTIPGLVLIFNSYEFIQSRLFSRREGSQQDVSSLSQIFHDLKFEVRIFNDLNVEVTKNTVEQIAKEDFSSYGCLMVIVMTHSDKEKLQALDGPYDASEIWEPFQSCPSLEKKPKIFLFEANGDTFNCSRNTKMQPFSGENVLAFACLAKQTPLRHMKTGTYFIQSLHQALKNWQHNNKDLLSILTELCYNVNQKNQSSIRKQMPCFVSIALTQRIIYSEIPQLRNAVRFLTSAQSSDDTEFVVLIHGKENNAQDRSTKISTNRTNMFGLLETTHEKLEILEKSSDPMEAFKNLKAEISEENIKFLAKGIFKFIFKYGNETLLTELLECQLPQEEVLHFLWTIITDCKTEWNKNLLVKTCTVLKEKFQTSFLQYHLEFPQKKVSGFPIMCVLQSSADSSSQNVITKLNLLVEHGADINQYYEPSKEKTPVHYAAEMKNWDIVKFLLDRKANIDIKIGDVTAREIIQKGKSDLLNNYPANEKEELTKNRLMFDALYEKNEEEFLKIFKKIGKDEQKIVMNENDGKYTLLQLAVKYKFKKAANQLIENGANCSAMAGYCKEPILIALKDPNLELLHLFTQLGKQLELRFCRDGSTFLHVLSKRCIMDTCGKEELFENLIKESIKQSIHLSAVDKEGKTALEICLEYQETNILFKKLLDNGGFLTIDGSVASKIKPNILKEYFDEKVEFQNNEILKIHYNFLKPISRSENENETTLANTIPLEMLPFLELSKFEKFNEVLIQSSLLTFFLIRKWDQFAFVYLLNFFLYFCFTIIFSNHVFNKLNCDYKNNTECNSMLQSPWTMLTILLWLLLVLRELFQYFTSPYHYIRNYENYLEFFVLFFSIYTIIISSLELAELRYIAATAIALIYIELTLLIGRHPSAELYITMFKHVSIKTFKLLFVFISFLFAFAFGFHILLHNKYDNMKHIDCNDINNYNSTNSTSTDSDCENKIYFFSFLWHSVLKIFIMSIGEFELEEIHFHLSPVASEIFLMFFFIFVAIVLMNLLNALAISDTQKIVDEASIRCCKAKIIFFQKLECMLLGYSSKLSSSKLKSKERCYGFDLNKENKEMKILHRFTKVFGSIFKANKSSIHKNNYSVEIKLSRRQNIKSQNNTLFLLEWRKSILEWLSKFYKKYILRIDEHFIALEAKKRNEENKIKFEEKNEELIKLRDELKSTNEKLAEILNRLDSFQLQN